VNDLKFLVRLAVAIAVCIGLLALQEWDRADSQRERISMMNRT
jgi:hypothetical protein